MNAVTYEIFIFKFYNQFQMYQYWNLNFYFYKVYKNINKNKLIEFFFTIKSILNQVKNTIDVTYKLPTVIKL